MEVGTRYPDPPTGVLDRVDNVRRGSQRPGRQNRHVSGPGGRVRVRPHRPSHAVLSPPSQTADVPSALSSHLIPPAGLGPGEFSPIPSSMHFPVSITVAAEEQRGA